MAGTNTGRWQAFCKISKVNEEQRIVEGYASSENPDTQRGMWKGVIYEGDLVKGSAIAAALPDYMNWANIREMHQPSAVGVAVTAEVIKGEIDVDGEKLLNPLHLVAKIVDDDAWKKVVEGVYKGFSIAGDVLEATLEKVGGKMLRVISKLQLNEISTVDRPAQPLAKLLIYKRAGDGLAKMGDPDAEIDRLIGIRYVLSGLQSLRNDAELCGDTDDVGLINQAIQLVMQTLVDEPDSALQAAAQPGGLQKAGKTFSGKSSGAVHSVIKALAEMLSGAGDAQAAGVLASYTKDGGGDDVAAAQKIAKAATDTATAQLAPLLDKFSGVVGTLAERVEALEKSPAPGGPVLRPVEKTLPGQTGQSAAVAQRGLDELRKLAATEPNPISRAEYNRQLIVAEQSMARR